MFDHTDSVIGLWPGERPEDLEAENQLACSVTCLEMADGWSEPDRHLLPDALEDVLPGPYLAAILHALDPERLNGHDAVRLMTARARLVSSNEAGKLRAMSEVAFSPPGDSDSPVERGSTEIDYAAPEIAAALTLTRGASEKELSRALSLTGRLRRVLLALNTGTIDAARARMFDQSLGHLPDETVDSVLDEILDRAPELTTGQLRAALDRIVLTLDPDGTASAFEEGLGDRGITTYPNPDLTGSFLIHNADPTDIAAARAHIEQLARALKSDSDPRTLKQIRVDVALDILKGQCVHQVEGSGASRINLMVPLETLLGLSDEPGELEGYGAVVAEIARKSSIENVDGKWTFTVVDNGRPVTTGTLSRRQQQHSDVISRRCIQPACSRGAVSRRSSVTSIIASPSLRADRLTTTTSVHSAATITWCATTLRGNSSDFPAVTTSGPVHSGTPMSGSGRRPDDIGMSPAHSPYVATRPFTIKTPSSASSLAWPASTGVRSFPPVPTTRHQGRPSLLLSSVPTARAAPGKPASAATSP